MDKKQVYPIAALFAICAVLVIGISWWVGSDAPATDTSATNRVTETTLTPEALPEYEETMHKARALFKAIEKAEEDND